MWRRLIYHPDINYALRQTLVLCLPVAVGLMLGELRFGLLFSLVPACCNIAGLDTPHKRFFKRLIIGASLFATCSLLTQLLLAKDVPLPFLLTGLTLVLGVTAELGPLHAKLLPASLLAAIFTLSLAGYMPVWEPLLIYALGTLWYGLFNWFWFWIWREQPLRESLSLLYRELADYCEAKYSLLTQHTDPEKALPPLLVRQQKAVDLITQCYQQMHMLSAQNNTDYKRMLRIFQEALDLQEHISVSLHQPEEVQKLVERSHAEEVIRWNAQTVAARLRVLADDILYHRLPTRFTMEKQIGALEKIARQHPDNPVGQFCYWHFSRIARVLRTQKPLYARDLLADKQRRMPLLPALKSYLSLKSPALRNAGRLSVMLSVASLMGTALHLPKSYWILMTVLLVTQNGYGATRLRIVNRSVGTVVGLIIAGVALHFKIPEGYTLTLMLITTLASYLILRKNAHDALEAYQEAIRLILSEDPQPTPLAWQRMRVNQAHNTLYNSLNQAMQEPAFNSHYLADMKLWVTHSQFIVEHINAMTTLAREHRALPPELAQEYLQSCEIAIQRCQQRLEYDEPGSSGDANIMDAPEMQPHEGAAGTLEQHLQRVIGHLNTMHTISSMAWRQRPHHGIWLSRKLRDSKA
ncbi:YccS/YhfK family putative transporter [Escherichia coli]|uniref:YccS/YhfK family putative transporter n=1 Tax=Escherichia coli TaxID=562 RepID=UPI000F0B16EB|nr:YccS/YhfK family putative transporter [Escherichia coli]